jgi:NAD-dependent deacetylase
MSLSVEAARAVLAGARAVAVLTGAGVSAESGIPTFRSNGGYWRTHRFEDLATPQGFARDPKFVWEWYEERRRAVAEAAPNAGHLALVELERRVAAFTLITQNVDGLHDLAGSKNVIKLHGDIWVLRCLGCGRERVDRAVLTDLPPYCGCGGTGDGGGAEGRCGDCGRHVGAGVSGGGVDSVGDSAGRGGD